MTRDVIATQDAPAAIGPYSQGIATGDFVFTAGQTPIDPATGKMAGDDIKAQTHQVFKNLIAVLEAAGSSLEQVVKVSVFLADMDDFAAMNEVYASYFGENPPARTTVQAARLPLDGRVEIDMIAIRG